MRYLSNPYRGTGLPADVHPAIPMPSTDAARPVAMLAQCPSAKPTPLSASDALARLTEVQSVWVKDERGRMGLGSFKALGAAYVIACEAEQTGASDLAQALAGRSYVTASAGNHGLSVAAGARVFGARAVIYLAETVPEDFAARLRAKGAVVVREGATYEDSMAAAAKAADAQGWTLLSDSSWDGYSALPHRLMEGYLALADEAAEQIPQPPTHIFLQAGVGGMAAAVAAYARKVWGQTPQIIVVEPTEAPALIDSIAAGRAIVAKGSVSQMGRLDCKEPSQIALKGLARDADFFMAITEEEAAKALPVLADCGLASSASGGAGIAGLLTAHKQAGLFGLTPQSRVLCVLSEGADA